MDMCFLYRMKTAKVDKNDEIKAFLSKSATDIFMEISTQFVGNSMAGKSKTEQK